MKNALTLFAGVLLIISSCKDKEDPAVAVTGISLSKTSRTLVEKETFKLEAVITPEDAADKSIEWASSKPDVATVADGVVTAVKTGSTTITAKSKSNTSLKAVECVITVVPKEVNATAIKINPTPASVLVGKTLQLTVTTTPTEVSDNVEWASSDKAKATVSPDGLVNGLVEGTVTITAASTKNPDVKGVCQLTVTTVPNNQAFISAITLGTEKFNVTVPAEGATTTVANAPRTISSILSAVPVTLTAAPNATFKKGETSFTSGGEVDFSGGAVTFKVTAEDGIAIKTYTVAITAYSDGNPYGVYTPAHLNDVRNKNDGHYKMMNDITLPDRNEAGKTATGIGDYAEKGWLPIGHDAVAGSVNDYTGGFTGIFDGGNFSVKDIYINRSIGPIGLFGVVSGATIRNLGVTGTTTYVVNGSDFHHLGALVGYIKGGSISNCYTSANVSMTGSTNGGFYVGGILGYSSYSGGTSISNSYSSGNISANAGSSVLTIGGFGGSINGGTINNCFATGNITATTGPINAGGFGGAVSTTTTNCYSTGSVEAAAGSDAYFGGFSSRISSTYTNCFRNSDAAIKKNGTVVSPLADASKTGITPKTMEEMQSEAFTTLLNGTTSSVWGRDGSKTKNNGLPYIKGVGVGK